MADSDARAETQSTPWQELAKRAWAVREHAHVHGKTRVGAAVISAQGNVFVGCNVEHMFRSHDVHAEVNALTAMAAAGDGPAVAIVIAAERERFTPCGGCLDWIFELGGPSTLVAFQGIPGDRLKALRADELMPHFPH
jgi:cytidine deaminase